MLESIFLALALTDTCPGGVCTKPAKPTISVSIDANVKVKVEKSKPKKTCGALCKVGRAVFGKRK